MKIDRQLDEIVEVVLDPRRAPELGRQTSKAMRRVVKRLARGELPSKIAADIGDERLVSSSLRELARRLALRSLSTEAGEPEACEDPS